MIPYELIDKKIIDYAELVICLFDHCNLKCVFCPQDHTNTQGASEKEILSKVPGIVEWINNNKRSTYFKLHIMGGEIFQDIWIQEEFLSIYQRFIDKIKSKVDTEKTLVFNFVTNLVFFETKKVSDFLEKNNLKISVSYDPHGRFTNTQFDIFKNNIEIFKDKIEMISLVMTKQNIEAVIKGDSYFDYLYNNFRCDWDSFLPSISISETLMPKESDLLKFYKHLVDNYPLCLNISYFTENSRENRMSCTRGNSYTVMYDGTNPAGCSGSVLLRDSSTKNLGSTIIIQKFFDQYNCFECEYFKKCPFTCFIKNDYKKIVRDVGECVFKETFKYVEIKNSIH